MDYKSLTKDQKRAFANDLVNNPVLTHIISELSSSYLNKIIAMDENALPHVRDQTFYAYKAILAIECKIRNSIKENVEAKTKK